MSYTDLLTYSDFDRDTLQGVDLDGMGAAIEQAITDATAQVEAYLKRKLIVREHTQALTLSDWKANKYEPYGSAGSVNYTGPRDGRDSHTLRQTTRHTDTMIAQADEWPVVQAETTGLSVGPKPHLLKTNDEDADAGEFTYFAGYRRTDQDLSALQEELQDLTALPDVLPPEIRRCAFVLATYELVRAAEGTIGRRRVQTSGPVSITVDSADSNLPQRELRRIDSHRKVL
jgi:hypothetical protein